MVILFLNRQHCVYERLILKITTECRSRYSALRPAPAPARVFPRRPVRTPAGAGGRECPPRPGPQRLLPQHSSLQIRSVAHIFIRDHLCARFVPRPRSCGVCVLVTVTYKLNVIRANKQMRQCIKFTSHSLETLKHTS